MICIRDTEAVNEHARKYSIAVCQITLLTPEATTQA